jgi:hypothetical protein
MENILSDLPPPHKAAEEELSAANQRENHGFQAKKTHETIPITPSIQAFVRAHSRAPLQRWGAHRKMHQALSGSGAKCGNILSHSSKSNQDQGRF